MRRDHFTLSAEHLDGQSDDEPTLVVSYSGPPGTLTARLEAETGTPPSGDDVDASFRLLPDDDGADGAGVFGMSRRLTGDFVLEANANAEDIFALVDAAREADETAYRIRLERPGAEPLVLDMEALLVYDDGGSLLRQQSLIPSGVEL
ncbi:DUF5793 family protein [Salinibaculum rarum]|uniref:DUF5793 family protein n=1 Tax=Salinibaculum rarum TaxID=3058903 RepID=UPI0026605BAD|nr:DUF5793 family protein [Salinibaculum sp. KK48]